jgi:hypothetical protein
MTKKSQPLPAPRESEFPITGTIYPTDREGKHGFVCYGDEIIRHPPSDYGSDRYTPDHPLWNTVVLWLRLVGYRESYECYGTMTLTQEEWEALKEQANGHGTD